ncbi:MAG: hypothetical protein V3V08_01365 [Nannocystaceae bacterium]
MVHRKSARRCLALSLLLVAQVSCLDEDYTYVDDSLIHEPRVTALRFSVVNSLIHDDPPSPSDLAPRATALPLEEVALDVSIVDASGPMSNVDIATKIRPVWLACLGQTPSTELLPQDPTECFMRNMPTDLDHISACRTPSVAAVAKSGVPPSLRGICRLEGTAEVRHTVPIAREFIEDGSLLVAMIGSRPGASSKGCADRFLGRREFSRTCLVAHHKLHLGPANRLRDVLDAQGLAGLKLEPQGTDEPGPPDRNLRIAGFQIGRIANVGDPVDEVLKGPDLVEVAPDGRFHATADELYVLHPVIDARDIQPLAADESDKETREAWWYYTSGSGNRAVWSDFEVGRWKLDFTWSSGARLSEARAEGMASGLVHLHVVVRDSRAGVGWASFAVEVR